MLGTSSSAFIQTTAPEKSPVDRQVKRKALPTLTIPVPSKEIGGGIAIVNMHEKENH